MVKYMLRRGIYLPVNTEFLKGAFISATCLRSHLYVPALGVVASLESMERSQSMAMSCPILSFPLTHKLCRVINFPL